jgi:ABC-type sugar transport system ATPase subunit
VDVAVLEVQKLRLRAGEFELRDVCLRVGPGEYFVLMGPTGSGKSLLAKCICGLIRPAGGRVRLEGEDVTPLEPRHRRVGYVPQEAALFPHMDVLANLTFPLRVRGARRSRAAGQVAPLIDMLALRPLLRRSTQGLSGGERQKVALGRALAAQPRLLILDEPVSALDEPAQRDLCRELKRVQRRLEIPTIHICHSVTEAGSVSDRVGVLVAGRLVQTGALDDLVRRPADQAVARLLNAEAP